MKHEIAYLRTEESNPFEGLHELHSDVWQRGPLTAFYVRDPLREIALGIRMAYLFGPEGLQAVGTCRIREGWRACVERFAGPQYAESAVKTCTAAIDADEIPQWEPSPDSDAKWRVASELRQEIEAQWPGVQEIVIRDFNIEDNQITVYLRMPDGDYYQGCSFQAAKRPHCGWWHSFGMAPVSSIRKWIFEMPYRLK